MDDISLDSNLNNPIKDNFNRLTLTYQKYLDQTTPYIKQRWIILIILLIVFITRILISQGWYIICYSLGIFLLNLFLAFLQPKFDPSLQQELQDESIEAGEVSEEFKPFIRRLSEFKFWYRAIIATILSIFLSLFSFTDIPVFWPILLIYFIVLFALTMRKQIQHMIKYRYIPFDIGKKKYGSK